MRKRPLSLYLCALLFLYFPLELWFRHLRGWPVRWFDLVLSVALPAVLLFGLIKVVRFGWYTLIAMVALWGVKDLYDHYASRTTNIGPLITHVLIYAISLSYFINPRIRHLYFDPKKRWWRIKPRYETHLPFMIHHNGEWAYPIMRNISEGGCFIETAHPGSLGDKVQLALPLPVPLNVPLIRVQGSVRWVSDAKSALQGMGVQFEAPAPEQNRAIREFVRLQL